MMWWCCDFIGMCHFFFRFFFYGYGDHRDLHVLTHSFPTRRSSYLFWLFVTIAVMPIFVCALILPSSSGLFFSWLGAVLNYAVQTAAITLALAFVVSVVG